MENERRMLQWGGIAGMLALIVWIIEIPLYGSIDPFTPGGLNRFTDVKSVLGLSTILMMVIAFLLIAFILALYRALRVSKMLFALFGGVLGVIGYIVTALGDAATFFAFAPISDLNQSSATTPETQATVVLLWQSTQGITNTFFFVGSLSMTICFVILGVAMFGAQAFGRRFGIVSIVLGMIGLGGVIASLFAPGEIGIQVMGIAVFANHIFLPIFGWKLIRLSRDPHSPKI